MNQESSVNRELKSQVTTGDWRKRLVEKEKVNGAMAAHLQRSLLSSAYFFIIYGVVFCSLCSRCNGQDTNEGTGEEVSTRPPLTGIPQIDYIWDPNLPRELNGYNMSNYPFLVRVPEKIDFKCDGLHDGFYASIPHKCQVYHHCLFGTRYDFLCANYTAFDQKNFICHFASEVDCENSAKFYDRNEALYKAQSTEAPTPAPALFKRPRIIDEQDPSPKFRPRRPLRPGRRRRPIRPVYYDDYYDYDYAEYDAPGGEDEEQPAEEVESNAVSSTPAPAKAPAAPSKTGTKSNLKIFDGPRAPPRIAPPVPNSAKKTSKTTTTTVAPKLEEAAEDYAEDNEEEESAIEEQEPEPTTKRPPPRKLAQQRPKAAAKTTTTTTTTTTAAPVEEVTQKRKPSVGLLNAAGRRPNVLVNKRLKAQTTTALPEEPDDEETEQIEEETVAAATKTPALVTRRPFRPAPEETPAEDKPAPPRRPAARRGPQAAPQPVEEEVEQPQQVVRKRPGSRTGPQTVPVEGPQDPAVQPAVRRRPSSRQGPQSAPVPVESAEESGAELNAQPVRKGPGFRRGPQGEQFRQQRQEPVEEADHHEETLEESQLDLSVLNLFSNAGPRAF